MNKHRFLFQSAVMDKDDFNSLNSIPHIERNEKYGYFWDNQGKFQHSNIRLRVIFESQYGFLMDS